VVEAVDVPYRPPQRDIAREQNVRPIESHDQEAMRRPRTDSRDLGQRRLDLVVAHPRERLLVEPAVEEAFRQRPQRGGLAVGHAARANSIGSAASSSRGDGMRPPKRSWTRETIIRVAVTDSCCPTT